MEPVFKISDLKYKKESKKKAGLQNCLSYNRR